MGSEISGTSPYKPWFSPEDLAVIHSNQNNQVRVYGLVLQYCKFFSTMISVIKLSSNKFYYYLINIDMQTNLEPITQNNQLVYIYKSGNAQKLIVYLFFIIWHHKVIFWYLVNWNIIYLQTEVKGDYINFWFLV